ncbi:MAG: apolipoprotein N-acyltransferase [Moraxella sp.]|nr:apolipoprotein N-acyltransferase [Moraxella sp.]
MVALLAGVLFSFSLAPYRLWPLAVLSPMLLYLLLVDEERSRRAFWIGQAYGFGLWAMGASWLYTSIHDYGNIPAWLAIIMIGLMAGIMGLFHGLMAWAFVRYLGRQPLAFASVWLIQEWAKTWVLTGFPWLFVGYAFSDITWLNSLAPVFGVLGMGFVVVLFGSSMIDIIRKKYSYLIISSAFVLVGIVLSLVNPSWTKPTGDKLSVSLVQGNIPQDLKWLTEYRFETLAIYGKLSQSEWGQDLVVWPESSIPMTQDEAWEFIHATAEQARAKGSVWATGIPYKDVENFNPTTQEYPDYYNGVLVLGDKNDGGLYKKQQLVPFGEYIPLQGLLNILPNLANMQDVVSFRAGGRHQSPLMIKNRPMGSAICYEVAYPNTTRRNAKDSEFLLTISNDAWFGSSHGPHQHLQMVQLRSLETGRWFMRATNTGITSFIDDKGRIVSQAPQFERTVLRGEVPSFVGQTPFMMWGHYPMIVLATLMVLLSFVAKKQTYRNNRTQKVYTADGVKD